jgi:hypothetical protein
MEVVVISSKYWIQRNAFHSFTNDLNRVNSRNILFHNKYLSMVKVQHCVGLTKQLRHISYMPQNVHMSIGWTADAMWSSSYVLEIEVF